MKKHSILIVAVLICAFIFSGCATTLQRWNSLDPQVQIAILQGAQQTATQALRTYLDYCHANKVEADKVKTEQLQAALDAANTALLNAEKLLAQKKEAGK